MSHEYPTVRPIALGSTDRFVINERFPDAFSLIEEERSRWRSKLRDPRIPIRFDPLAATWLYKRLREEMMDYAERNDHILLNDLQARSDRLTTDFEFRLTTTISPITAGF